MFPHSPLTLQSDLIVKQKTYLPPSLDTEPSDAMRFRQLLSTLHDSALGIEHYAGFGHTSNVQTFKEAMEQTGNAIESLLVTNQQQYAEIERLRMTNKGTETTELKKKLAQINEELTMWRRAGTLRCRNEPCQEVFMTVSSPTSCGGPTQRTDEKQFQALKNHEKGVHSIGAERFPCPYCSKT